MKTRFVKRYLTENTVRNTQNMFFYKFVQFSKKCIKPFYLYIASLGTYLTPLVQWRYFDTMCNMLYSVVLFLRQNIFANLDKDSCFIDSLQTTI